MTTTVQPAGPVDAPLDRFSVRLKQATASRHARTESSPFIVALMQGRSSAQGYVRLLSQYTVIYDALEAVAEHLRSHSDPITAPFLHRGLDRRSAIENDLRAFEAAGSPRIAPGPAALSYADAIRATGSAPERYLAHHYLRYLGDLSGGQAIAALIKRHYGVADDAVSMYRFTELPRPKVFKDSYHQLLDTAPLTAEKQEALIDEAQRGFDLNAQMFAELAQD